MKEKEIIKLSFNLPKEEYDSIKKLAEKEHLTNTEIIRRALRMEEFLYKMKEDNVKILLEKEGQMRELVFR